MTQRLVTAGAIALVVGACSLRPTSPSPIPTASSATATQPIPTPSPTPAPSGNGPSILPGSPIAVGDRAEVNLQANDTTCFPNWDSGGRCRQLNFAAPADGTLQVTLELPSPNSRGLYDPEAFIVAPDGTWDFTEDRWPVRHVSMAVKGGLAYRIVVISYGPFPDTVYVRAAMK